MTSLAPTAPSFVFGYWRPWNENADVLTSYLDYARDVSLTKYGADTVGQYVSQASKEHVRAIDKVGKELDLGFGQISRQLSVIDSKLGFLNRNLDLVVEQQRLSNLLLGNIAELLRVPDSEKERQHTIELGIKFFVNGSKDPDLYADALEMLLKAEAMMKQDYFVLHRIGCIYLHVEKHLDPTKALDYFTKAAKYASVESDPKAARLVNALTAGGNAPNSDSTESPDVIRVLAAESYEKAAFAAYVLGKDEEAVALQSKALELCLNARTRFTLSKYQMRNGLKSEALRNLDQAITDTPFLLAAVFREVDLFNEPDVLEVIAIHSGTYQSVCDLLQAEDSIVKKILSTFTWSLAIDSRGSVFDPFDPYDAAELEANSAASRKLGSSFENLRSLSEKPLEEIRQDIEQILCDLQAWAKEGMAGRIRDRKWEAYSTIAQHCDRSFAEITRLTNFVRQAELRGFEHQSLIETYGQQIKAIREQREAARRKEKAEREAFERKEHEERVASEHREEMRRAVLISDALTLLAAADGKVSSAEIQAMAIGLTTLGVLIPDDDHVELVRQAVAEIQAKGVSAFSNTVRDRFLPYRGTQFIDDVLKAMADLSERDGAVHENETRVINWFRRKLANNVP